MKFLPRAATFAAVTFCAGALANAATLTTTNGQDAPVQMVNAQGNQTVPALPQPAATPTIGQQGEIVQPLPQAALQEDQDFATLTAAVESQAEVDADEDRELQCLAAGVYYEAKSEPLAGQLAVAEVILNRTTSGRFPTSVCGVLAQRGQFSFVRGGKVPTPPANAQWRKALAVAKVAQKDLWETEADEALYFHATHARPGWGKPRLVKIGNHIFYR
jgi:spore germination cell wall hydrolase CwlJ-like protein